jgi:hypothetical protein
MFLYIHNVKEQLAVRKDMNVKEQLAVRKDMNVKEHKRLSNITLRHKLM